MREVPDDERNDIGLPYAIRRLPNTTVGEKVLRLKARLKHYGVKNIYNVNTIAGLTAQRDVSNGIIQRAKQRIDATPQLPQNRRDGFVVGEYKYSYCEFQLSKPLPLR